MSTNCGHQQGTAQATQLQHHSSFHLTAVKMLYSCLNWYPLLQCWAGHASKAWRAQLAGCAPSTQLCLVLMLCRFIAVNYTRIRDVEKELRGLQMQVSSML